MVDDKFKQAQNFRSSDDQLRDIAHGLMRKSERELLTQLAEEYDEMARSAAAIAAAEVTQTIGNGVEKLNETADGDRYRRLDGDGGLK